MLKFKLALQFRSLVVSSLSHNCCWDPCIPLLFFVQSKAYSSTPQPKSRNFVLTEYLTNSLKFPKSKAAAISGRFPSINSSEKPKAVVRFFKTLGISAVQIQSCLQGQPAILFIDVEKNIKPKIAFYQELGLCGPRLGMIISKNPCILVGNLDKNLKPSIGVIKEALELNGSQNCSNNISDLLFRILSRYSWYIGNYSRLRSSITYLRNCGVIGTQLIMLLKAEPRLFTLPEAQLKLLVSRATKMGFEMGSRMLAYGILGLYCTSAETIRRKVELLQGFGFSRDECSEVITKSPMLLKTSEAKLRCGIEFYLHTLMLDKSMLVSVPQLLHLSMDKRVIPRCNLLETLKSRNLLKKDLSFVTWLILSNKKFVERYILRFADDPKLLQVAYENHLLESPKG